MINDSFLENFFTCCDNVGLLSKVLIGFYQVFTPL